MQHASEDQLLEVYAADIVKEPELDLSDLYIGNLDLSLCTSFCLDLGFQHTMYDTAGKPASMNVADLILLLSVSFLCVRSLACRKVFLGWS